jgi:hypothetical protein
MFIVLGKKVRREARSKTPILQGIGLNKEFILPEAVLIANSLFEANK